MYSNTWRAAKTASAPGVVLARSHKNSLLLRSIFVLQKYFLVSVGTHLINVEFLCEKVSHSSFCLFLFTANQKLVPALLQDGSDTLRSLYLSEIHKAVAVEPIFRPAFRPNIN